ncbi:MAG: hypothetical protein HQ518_16315, partial [Rhodopirellula sp.]|nr:hypothetical protein [Rhodopirellula sp.]
MSNFNKQSSGGKTRSTERSVAGTVRRFASATALVILWMTPSAWAFAFDPPPTSSVPKSSVDRQVEATSTPQEQTSPAKPKVREKAQARKRNPALDRQLLRDLLPDLPPALGVPSESPDVEKKTAVEPRSRIPFADELDETVYSMREVSRRLDTMELSDETEKLQSGIVTNIDALIEKLRKLPPPSASDPSDKEKS